MSTSATRAKRRYNDKTYSRISLDVHKEFKELCQAHAIAMGESLNGFIKRAMTETMKRDITKTL